MSGLVAGWPRAAEALAARPRPIRHGFPRGAFCGVAPHRENGQVSAQSGTETAPREPMGARGRHTASDPLGKHSADDPRQMLARPLAATSLLDAVRDLRRDVAGTEFPLELAGADKARRSRDRLVDQLTEHLLPRLTELSAPAVVVVAGSTGAGKSTLVNSLVGAEVTQAGVLRPTTKEPVLVHHPGDADLLAAHPLLGSARGVPDEAVPRGIALLDAPDLDSVLESNRAAAHRLLEAADLWLFVTTAARYGDALPWKVLEGAVERGASIAMVLNRVPAASLPTVRGDLLGRLRDHGMAGSPLFVVPDVGPHEGPLAPQVVAPVLRWLLMLAGPDRARTVIGRTLRGSLAALRIWVDELAEAVQEQADAAEVLAATLDRAVQEPAARAADAVTRGDAVAGAVSVRWADLAGSRAPLGSLVRRSGRVRAPGRSREAREKAVEPLVGDLTRGVATTLAVAARHAHAAIQSALEADDAPAGSPALLRAWDEHGGHDSYADQAARGWVGQGLRAVRAVLGTGDNEPRGGDRKRARTLAAVGEPTLVAIALTAAAGVADARGLLRVLVGAGADEVVDELRAELARRAGLVVEHVREAAAAPLADPDLAPDAASRLRLRLAVIKGLT